MAFDLWLPFPVVVVLVVCPQALENLQNVLMESGSSLSHVRKRHCTPKAKVEEKFAQWKTHD